MPIYEYEPTDHDCLICSGRVEAIQGVHDAPLEYCPTCGLPVRRVISKASFKVDKTPAADRAAKLGFTTYRKAGWGTYEKLAGDGADVIVPRSEDVEAVQQEKQGAPRVLDLDSDD